MQSKSPADPTNAAPRRMVFGRLGLAAFLFFLIKGMAWLMIPALVAAGWLRS